MQTNSIFVFDMDETLGYFVEFSMFIHYLQHGLKMKILQSDFNTIADLYPELLRPNIIELLKYLKMQNVEMHIYTNNQGCKSWTHYIIKYIEYKVDMGSLFEKVICAYKVNDILNEPKRTTYEKTYNDLLNCINKPFGTSICFIDDKIHTQMICAFVHYIYLAPYKHIIPFDIIAKRYIDAFHTLHANIQRETFVKSVIAFMAKYKYYLTPSVAINHLIVNTQLFNLSKQFIEKNNMLTDHNNHLALQII